MTIQIRHTEISAIYLQAKIHGKVQRGSGAQSFLTNRTVSLYSSSFVKEKKHWIVLRWQKCF